AAGLQHAAGYLRSQLAQRIKIRVMPQLHFEYDASVERGIRLSQLIDAAVADDKKRKDERDESVRSPQRRPGRRMASPGRSAAARQTVRHHLECGGPEGPPPVPGGKGRTYRHARSH